MNIVQIGVNKSLDACHKFIQSNKDYIENIYLVEPLPSCIPDIKSAFKNFDNVKIFNLAICDNNSETSLKFYFPANDPKSGHASFKYDHLLAHGHRQIDSIDIECITLDDFFKNNSIVDCERLYIDTEGLDCSILLNFNYPKYNIKYIEFEKIHSDGAFTQGLNYKKCIDKFKMNNYEIKPVGKWNCAAINK
jgi:FkbM family methyltransferase